MMGPEPFSSSPSPTPEPSDAGGDAQTLNQVQIGENVNARQVAAGENITQIYNEAEVAYDVRGLPNPYLGLAAFTYAARAKYAGREKLVAEIVDKLTAPGAAVALLFITGASGSGKSSFAQAGLLPALEAHYAALSIKHAVFRPGREPLAALADALWRQLGLPQLDTDTLLPETFGAFLRASTPPLQINVVVIDQFEEAFTQAAAAGRDALFELLANLPPFSSTHTHVIATMRADYLPELFNHPALYGIAKQGVDLRAMNVDELRRAIQQPLRAAYPIGAKQFQAELVERLAQDAAQNAAYLPLLQVTLEEIWRKGSLTLGAYTNLTDAIEERADKVLKFHDYDAAAPGKPRSPEEQGALLDLLLNLVDVSLDDDARRDVRRQRSKNELAHGSLERLRLIDELASARLLSVEADARDAAQVDVDLIHESLLTNWDVLRKAIAERRHELHQRARFEQNLEDWLAQARTGKYLLDGVRLEEARELEKREDIALQNADAKAFLRASVKQAEAEQQQELERERQRADAEKRARDEAEKRAEAEERARGEAEQRAQAQEEARREAEKSAASERQRARILRFAAVGLTALMLVTIAAAVFAFQKQREAEQQARAVESRRLVAQAALARDENPDASLLLGIEALKLDQNSESRNSLFAALQQTKLNATIRGHESDVTSVAFSPDGKTLASASWDDTIRLWDVATGKEIGDPLTGHTAIVRSVTFRPDGKMLASASCEPDDVRSKCVRGEIRLWDVSTGKEVGEPLTGHLSEVISVAFSPDGKLLASASADDTVRLWDVSSGKEIGEPLRGHLYEVKSVTFSPDGKILASGSADNTIRLWDVSSGKRIGESLAGHTDAVYSVGFSPDGKTLASGSLDETIRVWDVASGKEIGEPLTGHRERVASVVFSPDGKLLASGSWDYTVRLWDVASRKEIGDPLTTRSGSVNGVAFSPDGRILASAGDDKTIRLWDVLAVLNPSVSTRNEMGVPLSGPTDGVTSVAFSPDGKLLAVGSCKEKDNVGWCSEGEIRIWDVASGKETDSPLTTTRTNVLSLAFSPDGKLLASGSGDGLDDTNTTRLWDVASRKEIRVLATEFGADVYSVTFSPDGKMLASGSDDSTIRLWDVASGKQTGALVSKYTSTVRSIAFRPDGKMLASGSGDTIELWDVASQKRSGDPLKGEMAVVASVAFSPDGKILAVGNVDDTIHLWDVTGRKEIGDPLMGHTEDVNSVAFSPDGRTLASGSDDKTIRLWDVSAVLDRGVASGKQIGDPLMGHTSFVRAIAFRPDGKMLASGSQDKMVRLWNVNLDPNLLEAQACGIVNRNLTPAEWADYFDSDPAMYASVYGSNPTCAKVTAGP